MRTGDGEGINYKYSVETSELEEENKNLKETVSRMKDNLDLFNQPPLVYCEVLEVLGNNSIIRLPNGGTFFVNIHEGCEDLRPGDYVLAEQKNLIILRKANPKKNFNIEKFVIIEKPKETWKDIGGLTDQINEIKEVIELPLKKPMLFKRICIDPPKGILLHGPPGTGKTLLGKAVAASTNSTFIEIVSSELIQKFIGEGAKLVKEIFQLAREKAPSIVFIDEIDALAATRMDVGTSGEREVQRTFMQLLSEIDGFKNLGDVKIIGCTNRKDILDPAIIRPGRLDRLIEVPTPNDVGRKSIFNIHTKLMRINFKINDSSILYESEGFSGAEIKAVCTEAGYFAIRNKREVVTEKDFLDGIEKVRQEEEFDLEAEKMFG